MGLRNSAQSFQRMMDHIMADIPDIFIYMDDILVYSRNQQSHMATMETIFKRLQDAGLALSLKKCLFGEKEIDFVGYRVTSNGITPLERKMDAIVAFPPPTKTKTIVGFFGGGELLSQITATCKWTITSKHPTTFIHGSHKENLRNNL